MTACTWARGAGWVLTRPDRTSLRVRELLCGAGSDEPSDRVASNWNRGMKVSFNGYFLTYPLTGSGQYLINLSRELANASPRDSFDVVPISTGARRLGRPGKVYWERFGWPRAARASGAQIVHSPYLSMTKANANHLMTVHDLIGFRLPAYARTRWMRIYNLLAKSAARRASLLIADSRSTANDLERVFSVPDDRVRVVPLGVAANLMPSSRGAVDDVRARYELPDSFVLYLGSGDTRKGLDTLIKALFLLPARTRPMLILAGNIPCHGSDLFPDYKKLAVELGVMKSVRFLGPVDDDQKAILLSAADVFVFPSRYEGFGLEPLEAMACGTPVICSDATSLPEVVGEAALLADPDEAQEWSEKIVGVLGDPSLARELSGAGRARAADLTWAKTARSTLRAFVEVL